MQKQASQTFQRIRKLSDTIIHAVVPNGPKADESFFEYGKKGWHPPTRPPDSYLHRRPSRRKVSKEDIRYPLLHPTDTHELWVESATMSAERARPPRPSLDERPLVVRDPDLRKEEQRVYKSVNTAKRPERPREEDLPYGSRGSYPKALVKEERPPPPLAAVRGRGARSGAVPFPTTSTREQGPSRKVESPPAESPVKIFSPFAPVKTQAQGEKRAVRDPSAHAGVRPTNYDGPLTSISMGPSSAPPFVTAQRGTDLRRRGTVPDPERRPRLPPKDAKWADPANHTYFSTGPAQVRRQGAIRRTSSSGDLHLPPQHARWQPPHRAERERERERNENENENEARRARARPPELRTVKSTPLQPSARSPGVRAPMPTRANPNPNTNPNPNPSRPPLDRLLCKPEPHDLDVPQDVSPACENPQRLPTPRRSEEDAYPALFVERERERERGRTREEKPMLIPQAPVATAEVVAKAQANMRVKESAAPRAVRVAGTSVRERPVSHAAQVVSPEPALPLAEPRRGRERARERPREGAEPFYGKADAFAREIGLALAEPESAPLSVKWENVIAGQYHGTTRPLAIKKHRG